MLGLGQIGPSSSRKRIQWLPWGKAAWAMRAVSAGTGRLAAAEATLTGPPHGARPVTRRPPPMPPEASRATQNRADGRICQQYRFRAGRDFGSSRRTTTTSRESHASESRPGTVDIPSGFKPKSVELGPATKLTLPLF